MPPGFAVLITNGKRGRTLDDPARGTPLRLEGRPARGSRLVITAAYVEERLARAREGRRRPGVRDARCCHASGAPVMPAWRHSATHARTGAENAGAVVRRPAQSARRGYHRLDRWSEEGGGWWRCEAWQGRPRPTGRAQPAASRGTHVADTTWWALARDMPTRHGGGEVASKLQPRTTHTHTHTHTTPS